MFWPATHSAMSSDPEGKGGHGPILVTGVGHLICAGMLVFWLDGLNPWKRLSFHLGWQAALVPVVVALVAVLAVVGAVLVRQRRLGQTPRWGLLVAALGLVGAGLMLTDPAFPAKRIHVAQYLLLGAVIRLTFCRSLPEILRPAGAWVAVVLYAFHDELLQGLHPRRTFGLDELGSDALAGLAAILVIEAWNPLPRAGPGPAQSWWVQGKALVAEGLPWILTGAILLILSLPLYRDHLPPLWGVLPLLAGVAAWFSRDSSSLSPPVRHWGDQMAILALLLTPYPVLPHVAPLVFH